MEVEPILVASMNFRVWINGASAHIRCRYLSLIRTMFHRVAKACKKKPLGLCGRQRLEGGISKEEEEKPRK